MKNSLFSKLMPALFLALIFLVVAPVQAEVPTLDILVEQVDQTVLQTNIDYTAEYLIEHRVLDHSGTICEALAVYNDFEPTVNPDLVHIRSYAIDWTDTYITYREPYSAYKQVRDYSSLKT